MTTGRINQVASQRASAVAEETATEHRFQLV